MAAHLQPPPRCENCRHHRPTPHRTSSCHHPLAACAWGEMVAEPIWQWIISMPPQALPLILPGIEAEASAEAVTAGRFAWPFNFRNEDLVRCNRFEEACANDR